MPLRDKTGPLGKGPLTGRGLGNCEGKKPQKSRPIGRGSGLGRGMSQRAPAGRGRGRAR